MSMSIEKALDKIADVLTKTTDDSNGSIEYSLSVIADALENGGGTGGSGDEYIAVFNVTVGDPFEVTSDETFESLKAAYEAGKRISGILKVTQGMEKYTSSCFAFISDAYGYLSFTFAEPVTHLDNPNIRVVDVNANGMTAYNSYPSNNNS